MIIENTYLFKTELNLCFSSVHRQMTISATEFPTAFSPIISVGLDLVSTGSTPQTVIMTEVNKKFVRYCVLDGEGVPVDSETHVLIVWIWHNFVWKGSRNDF